MLKEILQNIAKIARLFFFFFFFFYSLQISIDGFSSLMILSFTKKNKKTQGTDRSFCYQSWSLCLLFLFFSPSESPEKSMKNAFYRFCISLFPSHGSRRWLKINLKISGVSYQKKENRSDIETWSIDRVLNNKHFYTKGMQGSF